MQITGKGTVYPAEWIEIKDGVTETPILQLTNHMAHSFHTYFTNNGWYQGGKKLLFGSDRGNGTNLFSLNLESGEITQLTDFKTNRYSIQNTFINPQKEVAYFSKNGQVAALDLNSREKTELLVVPDGYKAGSLSCTADGKWVCVSIQEDLSGRIPSALGAGYIGFEETAKAKPHCQIYLVPADGGTSKVIHEDQVWIGHVNTSPTRPNLLTFCHEGPWDVVDHRIWCLNVDSGESWKIRPDGDQVFVGHEYWHADGIHIGYHGYTESLENKDGKFIGSIKFDNTSREEYAFPFQNMHIHSNDDQYIVGDGQQSSAYHGPQFQDSICLWKKTDQGLEGPRMLCRHRCSFHVQKVHVHPRFSPDGSKVLFTSDMSGYGNLYMADVPEFESLPKLPE